MFKIRPFQIRTKLGWWAVAGTVVDGVGRLPKINNSEENIHVLI